MPEDRGLQGLVAADDRRPEHLDGRRCGNIACGIFINFRSEALRAAASIKQLGIRARGPEQVVAQLSGGNQQKVVLGKWLETEPRILIMDEPTRGIDVGAKAEIHALMGGSRSRAWRS